MDTIILEQTTATTVVNKHKEAFAIYIGRGSKWGNPFIIGKDGDRQQVIDKYEAYIRRNISLIADLHELKGKRLGCFCKPQACHGDILVKLLRERQIEEA